MLLYLELTDLLMRHRDSRALRQLTTQTGDLAAHVVAPGLQLLGNTQGICIPPQGCVGEKALIELQSWLALLQQPGHVHRSGRSQVVQLAGIGNQVVELQPIRRRDDQLQVAPDQAGEVTVGDSVEFQPVGATGMAGRATVITQVPQIDPSTRTIRIRARIDRGREGSFPGAFVEAVVVQTSPKLVVKMLQKLVRQKITP